MNKKPIIKFIMLLGMCGARGLSARLVEITARRGGRGALESGYLLF